MRRILLLTVLAALSLAPAASFAATPCQQMCANSERECAKFCEKDYPECKQACKQSAKSCPETCEALMKHKDNPAAMGEALRQAHEKQQRQADEEPAEKGHRH